MYKKMGVLAKKTLSTNKVYHKYKHFSPKKREHYKVLNKV